MRDGVRAAYATEVRDLRADDDRCTACDRGPHRDLPGAEAAAVARKFTRLKHRLMPCPYAAAALPEGTGTHLLPGAAVRGTAGEVG
ncbi:hypothetical protein [Streptomyces lasiicapitis]|uniref:hypothetical protein n=1 Tax=Streptomyces lasiicapitis TaxID=1923961 RepID=UPI0036592E87